MIKIIVPLANGFEEIEAIVPVDVWRRAGFEVLTVSITDKILVTGAHNITLATDTTLEKVDFSDASMIFLPGGMPGAKNLDECDELNQILKSFNLEGKTIGAICAAPMVLGHNQILKGKNATCFPGFEHELYGANFTGNTVETDQNIVTAKGAGVAMEFALEIATRFKDKEFTQKLAAKMQVPD